MNPLQEQLDEKDGMPTFILLLLHLKALSQHVLPKLLSMELESQINEQLLHYAKIYQQQLSIRGWYLKN